VSACVPFVCSPILSLHNSYPLAAIAPILGFFTQSFVIWILYKLSHHRAILQLCSMANGIRNQLAVLMIKGQTKGIVIRPLADLLEVVFSVWLFTIAVRRYNTCIDVLTLDLCVVFLSSSL
jgi:hypothetical protein